MGCNSSKKASGTKYSDLLYCLPFNEFERKYELLGRSGQGAFATVRKAQNRENGKQYAVKILRRGPGNTLKDWEHAKQEIATLKHLDHPNIVTLFETYERPGVVYMVEQLCSGGELSERAPYSEDEAAYIFKQLVVGLKYLHNEGIMHRDIKVENIMFESRDTDALPVFIDFGGAKRITRNKIFKRVGTPYAMAPEQLSQAGYTKACDLWSMGVVLFMLLNAMEQPFSGANRTELIKSIRSGKLKTDLDSWISLSSGAQDLVSHLLDPNPATRFSIDKVLHHPWLKRAEKGINAKNAAVIRASVHAGLIDKMKSYQRTNILNKKAMQVIAYRATPEQVSTLRELFFAMDKNKSGTINKMEFSSAFGGELSEKELEQLFDDMDLDGSGRVTYSEFIAAALDLRRHVLVSELGEAFDRLDTDNDGKISLEDLRSVFRNSKLSELISRSDVQNAFDVFDTTHDGKISWDEFAKAMLLET